jgi:hypothetical protein
MNMVNYLSSNISFTIYVYTIKNRGSFQFQSKHRNLKIRRLASSSRGVSRYCSYLKYNLLALFYLLKHKPDNIFYYETYSAFPVFAYNLFSFPSKIFIHYHEYVSPFELKSTSVYYRYLNRLEKKIYGNAFWVSHTNPDRLRLFENENPAIPKRILQTLSNFPPEYWYKHSNHKVTKLTGPIKFVYVGALGINTTYVKEFSEWLLQQNGNSTLTIYSSNLEADVLDFLNHLNTPNIILKTPVFYFDLPNILPSYDVGLVLYNGHIPNYVYNVPNKVIEYYACGLQVWFSKDLITTQHFVEKNGIDSICQKDFNNLSYSNDSNNSKREVFSCEFEYKKLMDVL